MGDRILFIGGHADGMRVDVGKIKQRASQLPEYYMVARPSVWPVNFLNDDGEEKYPNHDADTYSLRTISPGVQFYVLQRWSRFDVLKRLVAFYVAPDKPEDFP